MSIQSPNMSVGKSSSVLLPTCLYWSECSREVGRSLITFNIDFKRNLPPPPGNTSDTLTKGPSVQRGQWHKEKNELLSL